MGTMEGNSKTGQANAVEQIKRFEKILIDHQANRFEFKITIEDDGKHHESAWARRLPSALNYMFPLNPN